MTIHQKPKDRVLQNAWQWTQIKHLLFKCVNNTGSIWEGNFLSGVLTWRGKLCLSHNSAHCLGKQELWPHRSCLEQSRTASLLNQLNIMAARDVSETYETELSPFSGRLAAILDNKYLPWADKNDPHRTVDLHRTISNHVYVNYYVIFINQNLFMKYTQGALSDTV